jgi:hypothetical protein
MLSFLNKYARNLFYSQNGEEGIVIQCVRRFVDNGVLVHEGAGHAVEIGANDGKFCSNTALMVDSRWSALMVESEWDLYQKCKANYADNPRVRVQCSRVDERNINAFVDERCDLLSLDTDGSDHKIFCGLNARPKIVIVEIDSGIEPPDERFNADGAAGYWSMTVAALERGYFVLCHTGNLVLVRQDYQHLFPECDPHPLLEWELYFNRSWVK